MEFLQPVSSKGTREGCLRIKVGPKTTIIMWLCTAGENKMEKNTGQFRIHTDRLGEKKDPCASAEATII